MLSTPLYLHHVICALLYLHHVICVRLYLHRTLRGRASACHDPALPCSDVLSTLKGLAMPEWPGRKAAGLRACTATVQAWAESQAPEIPLPPVSGDSREEGEVADLDAQVRFCSWPCARSG